MNDILEKHACSETNELPNAINAETFFEENLIANSAQYCENHCVFYNTCYANHSICFRSIFKKALEKLSNRERNVIKLLYGYNAAPMSVDEIAEKYSRTPEKIELIISRALRILRQSSLNRKIKHFLFDVFSLPEESFYTRLLSDVFGVSRSDLKDVQIGIDFDIIRKDALAEKTPEEIKAELASPINKIDLLIPYQDTFQILGITTLDHLLHTAQTKILQSGFHYRDIPFFGLLDRINGMGYQFKDSLVNTSILNLLAARLLTFIIDEEALSQKLEEFPLSLVLKLSNLGVVTINDLLNQLPLLKQTGEIDDREMEKIQRFLLKKHLVYETSKVSAVYLSKERMEIFVKQLIDWMIDNNHSVCELIHRFETNRTSPAARFRFLCLQYADFLSSAYTHCEKKFSPDAPLSELDFSVRTHNCLRRAGVETLSDLIALTEDEIAQIRHITPKCIAEIRKTLLDGGYYFTKNSKQARFDQANLPSKPTDRIIRYLRDQKSLSAVSPTSICAIVSDRKKEETVFLCIDKDSLFEYHHTNKRTPEEWLESSTDGGWLQRKLTTKDVENYCKTILSNGEWDYFESKSQSIVIKHSYLEPFFKAIGGYIPTAFRLFLQNDTNSLKSLSISNADLFS